MPTYQRDKAVVVPVEQLRDRADIQQNIESGTGSRGERLFTWQTIYQQEPCGITPLSGRELELSRQMVQNATTKILIRYKPNIGSVLWRVVFNGQNYMIGYVQDIESRHRQMVLTCYTEASP